MNTYIRPLLLAAMLAVALPALAESSEAMPDWQRQLEEENKALARYHASLTPVLTEDTVLAGIAMPKGTRLTLPSRHSLGTDLWTQLPYFLQADFPHPVMWQGVPLMSIERQIAFPEVFADAPPPKSPPTWGAGVAAKLAAPQTVNGFDCLAGEIEWLHPAAKPRDYREASHTDAARPAPAAYRLSRCLSAGQRFGDRQQAIEMQLPANSQIIDNRLLNPLYADGFLDVWSANGYGEEERLSFNLFDLSASSFSLHMDDRSLHQFTGRVVKGRADCPLKPGSAVAWHQHRPGILGVYGAQPDTPHCGRLQVEALPQLPPEVAFRDMILPLVVTDHSE